MGNSKDIMHDFTSQEIRRLYSSYDGWAISPEQQGSGYDTIFQMDRRIGGRREVVRVLATYDKEITPSMMGSLKKTERSPDGMIPRYEFAVMAPANANMSAIPAGIRKITMKSFSYNGDILTWTKKPVRKTDSAGVKTEVQPAN